MKSSRAQGAGSTTYRPVDRRSPLLNPWAQLDSAPSSRSSAMWIAGGLNHHRDEFSNAPRTGQPSRRYSGTFCGERIGASVPVRVVVTSRPRRLVSRLMPIRHRELTFLDQPTTCLNDRRDPWVLRLPTALHPRRQPLVVVDESESCPGWRLTDHLVQPSQLSQDIPQRHQSLGNSR